MDESQSLRTSNLDAHQHVGDGHDFDPNQRGTLDSYKRFLKGDDELEERTDTENLLANSYQADESSADQLQELIQMVQDQRNRMDPSKVNTN